MLSPEQIAMHQGRIVRVQEAVEVIARALRADGASSAAQWCDDAAQELNGAWCALQLSADSATAVAVTPC